MKINAITNGHPTKRRPFVTEPSYNNEEMVELEKFDYLASVNKQDHIGQGAGSVVEVSRPPEGL